MRRLAVHRLLAQLQPQNKQLQTVVPPVLRKEQVRNDIGREVSSSYTQDSGPLATQTLGKGNLNLRCRIDPMIHKQQAAVQRYTPNVRMFQVVLSSVLSENHIMLTSVYVPENHFSSYVIHFSQTKGQILGLLCKI